MDCLSLEEMAIILYVCKILCKMINPKMTLQRKLRGVGGCSGQIQGQSIA